MDKLWSIALRMLPEKHKVFAAALAGAVFAVYYAGVAAGYWQELPENAVKAAERVSLALGAFGMRHALQKMEDASIVIKGIDNIKDNGGK